MRVRGASEDSSRPGIPEQTCGRWLVLSAPGQAEHCLTSSQCFEHCLLCVLVPPSHPQAPTSGEEEQGSFVGDGFAEPGDSIADPEPAFKYVLASCLQDLHASCGITYECQLVHFGMQSN